MLYSLCACSKRPTPRDVRTLAGWKEQTESMPRPSSVVSHVVYHARQRRRSRITDGGNREISGNAPVVLCIVQDNINIMGEGRTEEPKDILRAFVLVLSPNKMEKGVFLSMKQISIFRVGRE